MIHAGEPAELCGGARLAAVELGDVLAVAGLGLAALVGVRLVSDLVRRAVRRRDLALRLSEWGPIADSLGLRAAIEGDRVAIRGEAGGRPFVIDAQNGLTYGQDAEVGLRVSTGAERGRFAIVREPWAGIERRFGPARPARIDEASGSRLGVWADEPGLVQLARFGAEELRRLGRHPELAVYAGGGTAWVRLGYRLDRAEVEAAMGLVERVWPAGGGGDPTAEPGH